MWILPIWTTSSWEQPGPTCERFLEHIWCRICSPDLVDQHIKGQDTERSKQLESMRSLYWVFGVFKHDDDLSHVSADRIVKENACVHLARESIRHCKLKIFLYIRYVVSSSQWHVITSWTPLKVLHLLSKHSFRLINRGAILGATRIKSVWTDQYQIWCMCFSFWNLYWTRWRWRCDAGCDLNSYGCI